MTIEEFCSLVTSRAKKQLEMALDVLWWHDSQSKGAELSGGQIAKILRDHSLANPNTTQLTRAIVKSKKVIRAGDRFKLRADARQSIADRYPEVVGLASPTPALNVPPPAAPVSKQKLVAAIRRPARTEAAEKPSVFVGSSVEGLKIANAIIQIVDFECESTLWNDGVIDLSKSTLEGLCDKVNDFDFAVMVLSADDKVEKRGTTKLSARDNVLFELGLFIGALGRDRVFIVHPRGTDLGLPSDLFGITAAQFEPSRKDGNFVAALRAPTTSIMKAIERIGLRKRS